MLINETPSETEGVSIPGITTVKPRLLSLAGVEIHPKIEELSSEDKLLENILYDIVQDVNKFLKNTKYEYRVSIDFSEDFEYPDWKHANIVIQIADRDYDHVLDLWDEISSEVSLRRCLLDLSK